jgi:hypothetical protein
MALYLGSSDKLKLVFNGEVCGLNLFPTTPIVDGNRLLSLDNYILKDFNGLYLTTKEEE